MIISFLVENGTKKLLHGRGSATKLLLAYWAVKPRMHESNIKSTAVLWA